MNVGRLSFRSSTSTLSIRTVCLGGCPLSVAATDSLYMDFSSWSSETLVLITPVMRSMKNSPLPSESRPATRNKRESPLADYRNRTTEYVCTATTTTNTLILPGITLIATFTKTLIEMGYGYLCPLLYVRFLRALKSVTSV